MTSQEQQTENLIDVVQFVDDGCTEIFDFKKFEKPPAVDTWQPVGDEIIFKHEKGSIILPVSDVYAMKSLELDYFILSPKKCYNSQMMRDHICHYMNYFLKFYDTEHELLSIYYKIKILIDTAGDKYDKAQFIKDLYRYFMRGSLYYKARMMNEDNYALDLQYRNTKNPGLQYTDKHAKLFLINSIIMNMMIPLMTHYIKKTNISATNAFISECFDELFDMYDVDLFNKLYETALSNISKNERQNAGIWRKQGIRAKNVVTHSLASVSNIIVNIMPKYIYKENAIKFNFSSILNNTSFQITDIGYEYNFISLNSSRRDQENNSEFDKFESYLTKQDEALYLQNKMAGEETMQRIELAYGPFSEDEIEFYMKELSKNRNGYDGIINKFQKGLIFNLFYGYFGDPITVLSINQKDYIKLMISAKKMLLNKGMVILPYILSGKVKRMINRKTVNKKENERIIVSPLHAAMMDRYKDSPEIIEYITSNLAIILTSEFQIIDYEDSSINGYKLETPPEFIFEELYNYVDLI